MAEERPPPERGSAETAAAVEDPGEQSGPQLLRLARRNRAAAIEKLRALSLDRQARACLELRPALRSNFLGLLDQPESVVPLLPETELAITIRAGGMSEAAWLLEIATPAQRRACFDLDCWYGLPGSEGKSIDLTRAYEWTEALIEAGRSTLIAVLDESDAEFWVLLLRAMVDLAIPSGEEEKPGEGWFTVDGSVYFSPKSGVDPGRVQEIFGALAERAPQLYWRFVYGILFESTAECEEEARRWRIARMADLGFPDRESAMRIYRPLRPTEAPTWTVTAREGELTPSFELPSAIAGSLIADALAELPGRRAAELTGYILAVANAVAVADGLRLSEPDSIPKALEKAVRGIEIGLRELAGLRGARLHEVLDATTPVDLFRIAATKGEEIGPRAAHELDADGPPEFEPGT
ncbi:MAG: hypothetical protein HRU00_12740 [Myxococcales bacterium]|nr:hypothetical protein [Myxococcales bacterium]